jgi:hypothetical protein
MARVDYTTDSETDSRLNPAEQAKFDQISAGYDSGSELSDREKDAINDLESQFDNKDSDLNPSQNDSASAAVNDQECERDFVQQRIILAQLGNWLVASVLHLSI